MQWQTATVALGIKTGSDAQRYRTYSRCDSSFYLQNVVCQLWALKQETVSVSLRHEMVGITVIISAIDVPFPAKSWMWIAIERPGLQGKLRLPGGNYKRDNITVPRMSGHFRGRVG